ncbi:MAG: pyridoxal-dependent decarboxylase [Acidimicrobiia bacterium]
MHDFDAATEHLADIVLGYALDRLRLDPVPLDHPVSPEQLRALAGPTITPQGIGADEALRIFVDVLAPACISTDSTRFFSFIPAAPTKASLLFDTVVGASSFSGASWLEAAGAVHAENEALRYLADLAGLPESAGGTFVSGGSAGNLSALVAARDTARARRGPRERWRVAVGEQAHSSIASTLRIIDVDPLLVPSDDRDRFTGPNLRAALDRDPDPSSVFAVAATAGTTNAGIIDDLPGLATVAREHDLWFHVDAAYGGAAMCAPALRPRFRGIEAADSFVVDPHKWLFAPFDCCALLYREPALARAVHAQHASYLDAIHESDEWNPSDYAYHLSRRTRGLPFWFSLAVHGTDAYRDAVERTIAITRVAAERIRAAAHVELVRAPALSIVLFRRFGWSDADYLAWSKRMLMEHVAFCLPTRWKGEMVARACFLHPNTTPEIVDELLAGME